MATVVAMDRVYCIRVVSLVSLRRRDAAVVVLVVDLLQSWLPTAITFDQPIYSLCHSSPCRHVLAVVVVLWLLSLLSSVPVVYVTMLPSFWVLHSSRCLHVDILANALVKYYSRRGLLAKFLQLLVGRRFHHNHYRRRCRTLIPCTGEFARCRRLCSCFTSTRV